MESNSKGSPGKDAHPSSVLAVKVQPGASKDRVVERMGDEWKLTLMAPAVEERANRACIDFLARLLEVPRARLHLVRGRSSRRKLIRVAGLSSNEVGEKLDAAVTRHR